jgi:hypothetical protein
MAPQLPHVPLKQWLACLAGLYYPTGIIVTGAGTGGTWGDLLSHFHAVPGLFIEADSQSHRHLATLVSAHSSWHACQAVVWSSVTEQLPFYRASNPAESGIIQPESLAAIWPNLTSHQREMRSATTLDQLVLQNTEVSANWLILDCLPALPLLQGCNDHLQQFDVIVTRLLNHAYNADQAGSSKPEIDAWLSEKGYRCIHLSPELHPACCKALYVRDLQSSVDKLQTTRHKLILQLSHEQQRAEEYQHQLVHSTHEKNDLVAAVNEQARQLDEHMYQLETAAKEKSDLIAARDQQVKLAAERLQQIEQLSKARDEQARLANQRQAEIANLQTAQNSIQSNNQQLESQLAEQLQQFVALSSECDKQKMQAEELRDQATKLAKEKTDLTAARDQQVKLATDRQRQIEQLSKARDEQARLASDRQAEIAQLRVGIQEAETRKTQIEARLAEYDHRQQLMNEELVRAEGQIDLIKDLLLREPGL